MRSGTDRCGAILDLIDRCLADYDGSGVTAPATPSPTCSPTTAAMRDSSMHDVHHLHDTRLV